MSDRADTTTPARPRPAPGTRLDAVHLLVTYRCTYACDHCFVWGSPEQDATMTLAQLRSVVDQAAAAVRHLAVESGAASVCRSPERERRTIPCR